MSPFLFSADLGATEMGRQARKQTLVSDALDTYAAQLITEYRDARAVGRLDLMNLIRDHAFAIDSELLAELDGFDYPAAA